jgi:hypothetical protein
VVLAARQADGGGRVMSGSLNLPFEPVPGGGFGLPPDPETLFSGGVSVGALVLGDQVNASGVPQGNLIPAVLFRFAKVDGSGFHPPVILGCDRLEDLAALPELVRQAVDAALAAAAS